jgi:phosphatidylserine/phosphatidylglycerophosphate/cardiolipin synthase-like enzyme/uncharacterized membrane protein YdjX (TVP38/TMEM64 family)
MPILKPGHNCWRIEPAERLAFLVDGADYFRAFRSAALNARRSILILAWDIYSGLRLVRDGDEEEPNTLRELLEHAARSRRQLHAYVLNWDFVMLYGIDREWLPVYRLDWTTHWRVHFGLDDRHPMGGSHHQKVVVLDDAVAFCGGLDLTRARWDTPAHRPGDPRRDEGDGPSDPHHDVQVMVGGPAARALGELARSRWRRACDREIPAHAPGRVDDLWPGHVKADATDVRVAIARTDPAYRGRSEVREVEQLFVDAIAAARRSIYIENQYFTSPVIGEALARRLEEPDGPEVVLVSGKATRGWLSQVTMDVLRARLGKRLESRDRNGRLRLLYPDIPGLDEHCLNVHAKVMVVDDAFVRVGSANLNNRSMGLDTECDLAFESEGRDDLRDAIAGFRSRLLAEHLGVERAELARTLGETGTLVRAIDALAGSGRTLRPLPLALSEELEALAPDVALVDPEQPVDPERLAEELLHEEERPPARRRVAAWVALLTALGALAAAWRWTPLSEYLDIDTLFAALGRFAELPAAPLLAVAGMVVGGLAMFPITLLIFVAVLAFGPVTGFLCALAGALGSALAGYGVGASLGRNVVRRVAGGRLNRVSKRLAKQGLLAVVLSRVVPIAPFTVINLVAGASHIGLKDFALGTLIGMGPGIAAITLFTGRIRAMLEDPTWENGLTLALVFGAVALAGYVLVRWLKRRAGEESASDPPAERQA